MTTENKLRPVWERKLQNKFCFNYRQPLNTVKIKEIQISKPSHFMRTTISILFLFIGSTLFAQTRRDCKPYIHVYKTADSIFSNIKTSGIDTILLFFLQRNSSEIYQSEDNSSDQESAYIFWQTKDSCYIKKINAYTIYQTRGQFRQTEPSDLSYATIFDYYKAKKEILDNQNFRMRNDDDYTIVGKDTFQTMPFFSCIDCFILQIKYKIGQAEKEKVWPSSLDRDGRCYTDNLSSELYHWTLIAKEIIAHQDRNQWWIGTKYEF